MCMPQRQDECCMLEAFIVEENKSPQRQEAFLEEEEEEEEEEQKTTKALNKTNKIDVYKHIIDEVELEGYWKVNKQILCNIIKEFSEIDFLIPTEIKQM